MRYSLDFNWLWDGMGPLAYGAGTTLALTASTSALGIVLSVLGAAARRGPYPWLRKVVGLYVEVMRNTPFLVQLFFIFFGLPSLGLRLDPISAAVLAMTLNMAAYTIEVVGAGLDAIPRGQKEAAQALGLRPRLVFFKIILPQALAIIFPALTSQIIIMMLESAVVSQISVRELAQEADLLQSRTFRSFETYLVATLIYLSMSAALRRLLFAGKRRFLGAGLA
ncbi:amino acid ABC transporter permease [Rhizobium binae]|uniref:Polar amino acid transport system permease protein n=1 Tax=Rhizobium binae TaxID=1138190 RepID=A0ABV2MMV8_9HYPH|nr:amino acid ABC transporter permease [Rhizobium binae]NKL48971.1 ABC transporter permease subunit [Rhizobium leguminosarum bv. viciae]MBX4926793.1 amino acid ABC transporter permease [Rhizobium binae]MBX4939257.1 amino acid ABC transporter permease [Rhizobium binae]MBX4945775.1 amino acid ABC transporter permease [Rhizobium binae]MBX4950318.1 amino acid ABC transporter permease [Rhizobium binae]